MRCQFFSSISGLVTVVAMAVGLTALPVFAADAPARGAITEAEVNAAQQAWCDGLVKIGKVYKDGGDYKAAAGQVLDDLYDYKEGKVFFKPTLASGENTFRPTREGALAYFVGGNEDFPEDTGFAPEAVGEGALRQQRRRERHSDPRQHRHHDGQRVPDERPR